MEEKMPCGIEHDRMKLTPIKWKNITFWGLPTSENPCKYLKFEVIVFTRFIWYKLVCANPFAEFDNPNKKPHPSGWDLLVYEFGNSNPKVILTEHPVLSNASFSELVAALAVLVKEQENPTSVEEIPTTDEFKALRTKWRRWMKSLPQWVNEQDSNN